MSVIEHLAQEIERLGSELARLREDAKRLQRAQEMLAEAVNFHTNTNDCCGMPGSYDYREPGEYEYPNGTGKYRVADCMWCAEVKEFLDQAMKGSEQ